jgi:hypothetical protein
MDGYAERIRETEIWELVRFIKSLGPTARQR